MEQIINKLSTLTCTSEENSNSHTYFEFDQIFTENMRKNFVWGGDWSVYKEDMHFEKKWQIRKTVFGEKIKDKNLEVYEIYYWNNESNQKTFIWSSNNKPKINYIDGINSEIILDGENRICTKIISCRMELLYINGTAPYEYSEIIASFSFSKDKKVLALPEKTIDIPKFSRVLKKKNIGLYGDDVFYLQFLINYIYSYSSLKISGYYDEATKEAVRNVQKFEKMDSTGIVDLNFWNSLTDTMNRFTTTYIYDFFE